MKEQEGEGGGRGGEGGDESCSLPGGRHASYARGHLASRHTSNYAEGEGGRHQGGDLPGLVFDIQAP